MDAERLKQILTAHKLWIATDGAQGEHANLRDADLRDANLRNANLRGANLRGADLDYSVLPLWCGSLNAQFDDKVTIQILYHLLSIASNSKNVSNELKGVLLTPQLIEAANKFHRVANNDCPYVQIPTGGGKQP